MASTKIRGITIELGADTSGLSKALKSVNTEIGATQKQLKDVEKLLKLDPTNTELLAQKQRLLKQAVSDTTDKIKSLEKAQKEVGKELADTGQGQAAYDALTREIISCKEELKKLEQAAGSSNIALSKIQATAQQVASASGNIARKMAPVTAALTAVGIASVDAASDLAEAQNKVEVAFGDSADGVKEFAETTLESYGIAKGTALDMSALFGDMATSMGLSQKEASSMSTSLVGLAGDLASFKNIGIDQASNALKGIFTGETESLKTLGVVMTQTNLDAYALANGFNKTTKEMTEAEKVQLRYQYILDKTKNSQGDFANTSDGTANSIRIFTESVKELEAELGEVLLPIITPIIQGLTSLIQGFGNLDEGVQKAIVYIGLFVAAIAPLSFAISGIASAVGGVVSFIQGIGGALATATTATTASTTAISGAVGGLASTVALMVGTVTLAITGLIAFLGIKGEELKAGMNATDDYLQNVFARDWSETFGFLGEVMNVFAKVANDVWTAYKANWDAFISLCQTVWTGQWQNLWDNFKNIFKTTWDSLATLIKSPINAIIGMANTAINGINNLIASFNRINFKLPKWLGGGSWSPNISKLSPMPMLASGGTVTQGSAIVGEAGAELLNVSNGQARVTPLQNQNAGHGDITELLQTYLPYLANNDSIVLDSGVLVGQIAPQMSNALGRIYNRETARR